MELGETRRIGILGGTFDPIHNGHLVIAEEARARLQLERVLFIPANVSPLKQGRHLASTEHRCAMVELAIADNPSFALSLVDLNRPAPSYTVDTLRLLRDEYGKTSQLYFIMGQDTLGAILAWRAPEEIIRLCTLVAVSRPGYRPDIAALSRSLPGLSEALIVLETPELSVSSTELRQRVARGWPIRYQLPDSVEAYIRQRGLYREEPPAADAMAARSHHT
jgi:nicotinate-nucleotide adenylyltransferase